MKSVVPLIMATIGLLAAAAPGLGQIAGKRSLALAHDAAISAPMTATRPLGNGSTIIDARTEPGSDFGAKVMAAYKGLPTCTDNPSGNTYPCGIIDLRGFNGNVTQTTEIVIKSPFVSVIGPGIQSLFVTCTINGDCWRIQSNPFTYSMGGGTISGFMLWGNGASSHNGVGLHVGDIYGLNIEDVMVYNFRGTKGVAVRIDNLENSTERLHVVNCDFGYSTTAIEFSNSGGTTNQNSFGYQRWDNVIVQPDVGETGISFDNQSTSGLMYLYHGEFGWIFEDNCAQATGSNTWLNVGNNVQLTDNVYAIRGEDECRNGGTSIALGTSAKMTGVGSVQFIAYNNTKRSENFSSTSQYLVPYSILFSNFSGVNGLVYSGSFGEGYSLTNPAPGTSGSYNRSPLLYFDTFYGSGNSKDFWGLNGQTTSSNSVSQLLISHRGAANPYVALASGIGLTFQTNGGAGAINFTPNEAGNGNYPTLNIPAVNGTLGISGSPNGITAKTLTFSGGTVTFTFGTPYSTAPVCTLGPSVTGNTYKVVPEKSKAVITSSSGSDTSTIGIICMPAVN